MPQFLIMKKTGQFQGLSILCRHHISDDLLQTVKQDYIVGNISIPPVFTCRQQFRQIPFRNYFHFCFFSQRYHNYYNYAIITKNICHPMGRQI